MTTNVQHTQNSPTEGDEGLNIQVNLPEQNGLTLYDLIKGVAVVWGMSILLNLAGVFVIKSGAVNDILFMFIATGVLILTSFSVSIYFVCVKHNKNIIEGFLINNVKVPHLVMYVLGAVVLSLLLNSFEPETLKQDSILYQILSTKSGRIAVALLIPFASIVEELYYRGFIFPILLKYLSPTISILTVSLWFSAAHFMEYGGNVFAMFAVFTLGLILTLERYYTKSLTPSLITHFVFNLTTITMVFLML